MGQLRQTFRGRAVTTKFLVQILCQRIIVQQGADGKILQRFAGNAKLFGCTHTHIRHSLGVERCHMNQFRLHAIQSIGAGAEQT